MGPAEVLQYLVKEIRAFGLVADHFHWLLAIGY
jgi:hypothetical protein